MTATDLLVQGEPAIPVVRVKNQQFIGKVKHFHWNTTNTKTNEYDCNPVTGGMEHFVGHKKPWRKPIRAELIPNIYDDSLAPHEKWLYWLGVANRTLQFHLTSILDLQLSNNGGKLLMFNNHISKYLLDPRVEIPSPLD